MGFWEVACLEDIDVIPLIQRNTNIPSRLTCSVPHNLRVDISLCLPSHFFP